MLAASAHGVGDRAQLRDELGLG
ncbi:MAG: hypothetical protein QOH83_1934, partial [Solirubrobacteraceae bacterium]|nr:hypothetical protein [Solirubrobacteraceae bacterium]